MPVPAELQPYPVIRGGSRQGGWWAVNDGSREIGFATAKKIEDWAIPPGHLVDYDWLKDAWGPLTRSRPAGLRRTTASTPTPLGLSTQDHGAVVRRPLRRLRVATAGANYS